MTTFIDTHTHLDGEEFATDRPEVIARAKAAGVGSVFIPAIDVKSVGTVLDVCHQCPGYAYPMIGLHPEEVREDWADQLDTMQTMLDADRNGKQEFIAIGEVGLDYYWSREYEREQLLAFERQVQWAIEYRLPLMIHCRKGQNEMVKLLRKYEQELVGGVFHCFTGNQNEAQELLGFERFSLGIGGVLTFKSSHLRDDLPAVVPLSRIVLETDSPYMAPVPHRGKRNESAYVADVMRCLAASYGVSDDEVAQQTNRNVERIFGIK